MSSRTLVRSARMSACTRSTTGTSSIRVGATTATHSYTASLSSITASISTSTLTSSGFSTTVTHTKISSRVIIFSYVVVST